MHTNDGTEIKFYYKTENLFNRCKVISSYRADSIRTEGGQSMLHEYSMTDDERDAFLLFLEDALYEAGIKFRKLHADATGGIFFNEVITESGTDEANGFIIQDHDAYNENMLAHVDNHTRTYLINFILYEWYKLKNLTELAKVQEIDMMKAGVNLDKTIFQFYKPLINT